MDVTITARHCTLPESLKAQTEERLNRLVRFEPSAQTSQVYFHEDAGAKHAEIRLSVGGRPQMQAHGTGDTFRGALDQAVARAESQLRRRRARYRSHKAPPRAEQQMSAD